jgi:hypothetical protein
MAPQSFARTRILLLQLSFPFAVAGTVAILLPLILIAQRHDRSALLEQCRDRSSSSSASDLHLLGKAASSSLCGFSGNSDIYGLGIRLGLYLQWLCSTLALASLRKEISSMAEAYIVFSLALFIALLVLTFQQACTFTAEVIIVLFLSFGGSMVVVLPSMFAKGTLAQAKDGASDEGSPDETKRDDEVIDEQDIERTSHSRVADQVRLLRSYKGWIIANSILLLFLCVYGLWFWTLLASGQSGPFIDTPGCGGGGSSSNSNSSNTAFFLLAHAHGAREVKEASIFIALITSSSGGALFMGLLTLWLYALPIPRKIIKPVEYLFGGVFAPMGAIFIILIAIAVVVMAFLAVVLLLIDHAVTACCRAIGLADLGNPTDRIPAHINSMSDDTISGYVIGSCG